MKTKEQKIEQTRKIMRMIEWRKIEIQSLKGGLTMSNETLRQMFKDHPSLKEEWEMLENRKFKLKRHLWRIA
jgi:hypothetical protein